MHHADVHALNGQTIRGFKAKQAATDYDCFLVMLGSFQHCFGVCNVAIADHTGQG